MPLRTGMVTYPGDPPFRIRRDSDMERGDRHNSSSVALSVHTGTHMDAPVHFLRDGSGLDALPLEAVMGPARVVSIRDPRAIEPAELERHDLQPGERVLFRTANTPRCWRSRTFVEDFVHVSPAAARYLVGRGVRTVGVDYLSVGEFHQGTETHETLLLGGVWIIEGLDLTDAPAGDYDLVCLPLKLVGADGAPARCVLRPRAER